MAQQVMSEYRERQLEKEFFARSSFKRPCELIIKHGRDRMSYWGVPDIVASSEKDIAGQKMSAQSVFWSTKRDMPIMLTFFVPQGMKLENLMNPCKYTETDRGYQNVISLVIACLVMLNLVDFYMMLTMAELGTEAFVSPFFIGPFCGILGIIITAIRFNQTHFTYRFSAECYEPEAEGARCHLVYAVDCDIPVHKQLWYENIPDLAREAIGHHQEVLNEIYIDLRGQVGDRDRKIGELLRDRKHERVLTEERAQMMRVQPSIFDQPILLLFIFATVVLVGLAIWLVAGG